MSRSKGEYVVIAVCDTVCKLAESLTRPIAVIGSGSLVRYGSMAPSLCIGSGSMVRSSVVLALVHQLYQGLVSISWISQLYSMGSVSVIAFVPSAPWIQSMPVSNISR